jgi:TetR/AcrR family transcriptional repressor of uid operon
MSRPRNPDAFAAQQAKIRRAAEICIRRSGFHGAGIAAICAEAGISPGRLYHYYPGKAALIAALVHEAQGEALAALAPLADLDTPDYFGALFERCIDAALLAAHLEYATLALEISAEATRDPQIAAALADYNFSLKEAWSTAIAVGQARGAIAKHLPPGLLADLILLVLDGATGLRIANPTLDDISIAARVRILLAPHFLGNI